MAHGEIKWNVTDLSQAMANAIFQCANGRFLRQKGDIVRFNGFWRDGDKQNVCAWLDKATWHDAKTGDGGGCKEFARVAFNLSLPEFMQQYGHQRTTKSTPHVVNKTLSANALAVGYIDSVWNQLCARDQFRHDRAGQWLEEQRGILHPRSIIGSGFANLYDEDMDLFGRCHHELIRQRLSLGPNLVAPIRDARSNTVQNFLFRSMAAVGKDQKSRLLTGAGGFGDSENPRGFGFPRLINDFPHLILCEGMADYFATEFLLDDNEEHLPLGAVNADGLIKWAQWLSKNNYNGMITIIFHLDTDKDGAISTKEIGPQKAIQAGRLLTQNKKTVQIFPWHLYLTRTTSTPHKVKDLADSLKQELLTQEWGWEHLKQIFLASLGPTRGNT
jgi:hypothetical protein